MLTRLIRLRLARIPKTYRTFTAPTPSVPPAPLPPLSSLHLPSTPTQSYPLYRAPPPPPPFEELPTTLDGLPSDKALQIRQKQKLTRAVENGVEEYTEDQLREFYVAVVTSGAEGEGGEGDVRRLEGPEQVEKIGAGSGLGEEGMRAKVLRGVAERFAAQAEGEEGGDVGHGDGAGKSGRQGGRGQSGAVRRGGRTPLWLQLKSERGESSTGPNKPLGESYASTGVGDAATLVDLLETLPRLGVLMEREQITELLDGVVASAQGDGKGRMRRGLGEGEETVVAVLAGVIGQQAQLLPAEQDALTRIYLLSDPSGTSAIAHLRHSESLALPTPQSSYNLVLHHLTHSFPTSTTRSVAWDLFTHMRLVAHPLPDPSVYSTMISSCAASADPRPEMARDLWIQMTQEQSVSPTEVEYTAYIRALCSTRGTYLEGFDVFRQMLARHHEATYVPFEAGGSGEVRSRYVPTKATWKALLEGTKRAGDLGRARWVLQECVRLHAALGGQKGSGVDEEVMASVFMTYAAWKPTVRRVVVREKEGAERAEDQHADGEAHQQEEREDRGSFDTSTDLESPPEERGGMFASRVPVTSADALFEAQLLFDALLPSSPSSQNTIFADVQLTTRLLNSFLSVTYAHASIADCRSQWSALSPHYSTTSGRNGWSYLHALERCSVGQRTRSSGLSAAEDRASSLEWTQQLWEEYTALSSSLIRQLLSSLSSPGLAYSLGISPRQVERCWRAIIRAHALSDDTSTALSLLTQFHTSYPPEHITQAYVPNADHGFSVRFTDPTTVAEADVPPHLLWRDVDVLHQRLVRDERWNEVGRVKWVCAAYEAALKRRRRWRLDGVGKRREARKSGVKRMDDGEEVGEIEAGWEAVEEGQVAADRA